MHTCKSHLAAPALHKLRNEAKVISAGCAVFARFTANSSKVPQQHRGRLQDLICMQQSTAICEPKQQQ
jgi:hypothetical protein